MSSYECGVCGWAGRMPWGRECPQCHPKTDQQITFQVLAGRRDEEAIAAAKRYVRGLEAQVQRVRASRRMGVLRLRERQRANGVGGEQCPRGPGR